MEKNGTLGFTDSEIEIIFSPRYPVSFIDVSDVYHRDADVTAVYEREKSASLSAWSWIGVFEQMPGVTSSSNPKAFAWSRDAKPIKDKVSSGTSDKFSVVFSKVNFKNFPIEERHFQFLFISCNDEVIGVSKAFRFHESADEPDLGLYDFPSFTLLYAEEEECDGDARFQDSLDLLEDAMIEEHTESEHEARVSGDDDLEVVLLEDGYETEQKIERKQNRRQQKHKKQQHGVFKQTRNQRKLGGKSTPMKIAMPKLESRKQKAKKRVCWQDHNTLMSSLEDDWKESLNIVVKHPIVEKYLTNKERAVVPYVPVYSISDIKNAEKTKKEQKSPSSLQVLANKELAHCTFFLRPYRLSSRFTEMLLPVAYVQCSNCVVMRSVLDVCRGQRDIGADQTQVLREKINHLQKKADDLAEDVSFLQMRALFSENENAILRDVEVNSKTSADDCVTLRKAVEVLQDQTKALCVEKNFFSEKLKQTESYLASANQKYNVSEKRLSEAMVALSSKTTKDIVDSKAGVSHGSKSRSEKKSRCAERQSLIIKNQCAAVHGLTEKLGEERQRTHEYRKQLNELAVKIEDWEKTVKEDAFQHARTKEELECSELVVMNLAKQLDTNEEMMATMTYAAEQREQGLLQTISYLRGLLEENGNTKTMKTFQNRMVASGQPLPSEMTWTIPAGQALKPQEQRETPGKKSIAATTKEHEKTQEQETVDGATAQKHQPNTSKATTTTTKTKNKNKAKEDFTAVTIEAGTENSNNFQDGAERASITRRTPGYKHKKSGKRNNHGKKQKVVDSRDGEEHKEMSCKGSRHKSVPEKCPECGASFAGAMDSRVIDEHMAFHTRYLA